MPKPSSASLSALRVGGYNGAAGAGILTVYCVADFNVSGVATVKDIFDVLSAWFAGC